MKKASKKPSLFKRFLAHLPQKGQKMPRNLKVSAFITGTLQVALTGLGTAIGVTSAATFPGMVALGVLGFVAGNVAGGLIGLAAFSAVIAHNLRKAAKDKKSAAKKAPAPEAQKPAAPVADKQLKSEFKAANENKPAAEKSAQQAPQQRVASANPN